ncbi:hypothetical protein [Flagellimonas nanhaiensis]|uniref:Type II secretion system protein GspC N-terminal domain-containing protein n=1 Tax=Flagellimonas nanhaiensis TaxID=2292706 RepID=A0A371JSI9_9FLAO|nr:hypothetical protein [Allomuricauda nanhaiensis]RDY60783.1 hypothetical protein DX873_00965 [Allomuricauda nanhaiensis]
MSKNVKTYVLLGLVLAIWGIIGYRLLGVFSPESDGLSVVAIDDYQPKKTIKKDTFSLIADYRDPFLGTRSKSTRKKQSTTKVKAPTTPFPNIVFTGLVSGGQTKDNIFFVTIAGNQKLMKKGSTNDGVTLLGGSSKSIRVRHKGIVKTIPIQNAEQ